MVGIFGWLRKKVFVGLTEEEADFETILEEIDAKIRETEISSTSSTERKIATKWLFYSISTYFVIFFVRGFDKAYLIYLQTTQDDWIRLIQKSLPVVIGPFMYLYFIRIFAVRSTISKWYRRRKQIQVEQLEELRKKQQLKVEELKKKTSYYVTKGLIERYETPTKEDQELRKRLNTPGLNPTPSKGSVQTPNKVHPNAFQTPNGQFPQQKRHIPHTPQPVVYTPAPQPRPVISPTERTWVDRFLDAIVGEEEGPEKRYALICEKCFTHNGLVMPQEYQNSSISYLQEFRCMKCNHLTSKQKQPVPLVRRRADSVTDVPDSPSESKKKDSDATQVPDTTETDDLTKGSEIIDKDSLPKEAAESDELDDETESKSEDS